MNTDPDRESCVPLTPRVLGRTGRPVAPVVWRIGPGARPDATVLARAAAAGAGWVLVDADAEPVLPAGAAGQTILGIGIETLLDRTGRRLVARLDALPGGRCDAVLLQHVTANDLKSGRPFHRLGRLRDDGRTSLLMLEAHDAPEAEWMVENTPAHAVGVPYGIGDQTVRYRVLEHARGLGVAILAREPDGGPMEGGTPDVSMALRLGDPDVAATVEPLPASDADLARALARLASPMPEPERQQWWDAFQQKVPAPAKPRGGHPPEFA